MTDLSALRRAEMVSVIGAGVIGVGLGVLGHRFLHPYIAFLLAAGTVLHGAGMWDRHRRERSAGTVEPSWTKPVYFLCWGLLLVLGMLLVRW